MNKKLIYRRWLIGASSVAFVAAGITMVSSSSIASASAKKASVKVKSVLFVNPLPNDPQWKQLGACMGKAAHADGYKFTQSGPSGDSVNFPQMVEDVQTGIADHYSAIITAPLDGPAFQPTLKNAREHKIVVVTLLSEGTTTAQNADVGVNYGAQAQSAEAIIAKDSGPQNVGIITVGNTPPNSTWVSSFTSAAASSSNVKVVTTAYDAGNATTDQDVTVAMLEANPSINMIATNEGAATPGILAAIAQEGDTGKVFLTGNGSTNGGLQALQSGTAYSLIFQSLCAGGTVTMKITKEAFAGKAPKETNLPYIFVTKANYEQYLKLGYS
jgi:ABC-type sugar transport system substrate-binding protein